MTEEKENSRIGFRCTKSEKKLFEAEAKRAKQCLTDFIKHCIKKAISKSESNTNQKQ